MSKGKPAVNKKKLSDLVKKFSKNDVIAEMEKEYQSSASKRIPLELIDDNAYVKKVKLSRETIERFGKGITEKGLFNPLVVRPSGSHYELILGRKRYFGAKRAALSEVPCAIIDAKDEETLLMLLADTRDQREGNVVEMALLYNALSTKFAYSQATLANLSHESRSQVTNTMRILKLPDHVLDDISLGRLSYGHARAIASLSDQEIENMVERISSEHLSVRETEEIARQLGRRGAIPLVESDSELLKKKESASSVLIKRTSVVFNFNNEEEKEAFIKRLLEK